MRTLAIVGALCAVGAGQAYAPRGATGWIDGYRAVSRELPAGQVDIASFGLVQLTPDDTPAMPTLHVRLVVANQSDRAPWAFDARTAMLVIGDWRERATFANSDRATLPVVILERGETALIDLYFAVPARPTDLSHFDVTWQLATGQELRDERTRFHLEDSAPSPAAITHRAGWGNRWWFDPSHEWASFYHQDGVITPRSPTRVLVTQPPSCREPTRNS
jgi:hypothetical protein